MCEPSPNIFCRDLCESVFQSGCQGSLRAGFKRAENCFEFGNALFNRIKVGRVRGQILYARPRRFDQAHGPWTIMELHIIQTHDVVSAQFWRSPGMVMCRRHTLDDENVLYGRTSRPWRPFSGNDGRVGFVMLAKAGIQG